MNMSNTNLISEFLKCRFLYEDTCIEFTDGSVIKLSDMSCADIRQDKDELILFYKLPGYGFELGISTIDKNTYSITSKLEPECDNCIKARKVTSLKLKSSCTDKTRMLIHGGRLSKDGIWSVDDVDEEVKCRQFYSCFEKDDETNAFTVIGKIPSKFRSEISVNKTEDGFILQLDTIVPYSFDGTVVCQEWTVSLNMPYTEAIENDVGRYPGKQTFENPIGWSTWDYYFTSATEDDVKQNVDFIANDEILSKKVRYIALDDGWQQREGDWKSGIRYPGGLKSLVDYIKSKGFEAGIWIAPTRLHFLCGTVMRRNSFLVRNEYGDPIQDEDMYILDPTHPDGEAYLRECFEYLGECGFSFYKLDFVSNLIKFADRFYDKNAGHYDALRKLIEIARTSLPEGSHIMGCSFPYATGTGCVDSRRTGWDIHNTWDHVQICSRTYLPQYASNGKLFRNDIDYLLVRGPETSDDPQTNVLHAAKGKQMANPSPHPRWRGGEDLSYVEAKTWCTIVLLTGSSVFMGDNLPLLKENGLELLRRTLENADFATAVPALSGDTIVPEVWYKKESGKLYVINYSDEEKMYSIPVSSYLDVEDRLYRDVFTDAVYKIENGRLEFSLKAHDSLCLSPDIF